MISSVGAATLTRLLRSRPLPSRERWSARGSYITSPLVGEVAPNGRVRGEPPLSDNNQLAHRHPTGRAA